MPSYIPKAKYPEGLKSFNIIKMYPELFKTMTLEDFVKRLGSKRFWDFNEAGFFLFASKYQENDGAKLVMILSSIERIMGEWRSLDNELRRRDFRSSIEKSRSGEDSWRLIENALNSYNKNFGSANRVVSFYQEYLSNLDKLRLAKSIKCVHKYKKEKIKNRILLKPIYKKTGMLNTDKKVNIALSSLLRNLIYHIRSKFVHEASYVPFPNKKFLLEKKMFLYNRFVNDYPKDQWVITLSFENFHSITRNAFINFWKQELSKDV